MYHFFMSFENITSHPYYFQTYWNDVFDTPLPWLNIFRCIYSSSCSTYLWAFQLKMFYKMLPTRKMLKIWRMTEDNICRFCGDEEEDIMCLFWYCPVVSSFWQQVANWLSEQAILLPLSPLNIIWGYQDDKNMLLNIIVLLGKLYIFDSPKKLVLSSFILHLKH